MKIYAVMVSGVYVQGNGYDDYERHYDRLHSLCTSLKQAESIAEKIEQEWKPSKVNFLEDVEIEEKDLLFQSEFAENSLIMPPEAAVKRMTELGLDPSEFSKWFEFFEEERIAAACKALKLVNTDAVKQRITAIKSHFIINSDDVIAQNLARKFEKIEFEERLGVTYGFGKNDVRKQQNYDKYTADLFSKAEREIAIEQGEEIIEEPAEDLTEDCGITMSQ